MFSLRMRGTGKTKTQTLRSFSAAHSHLGRSRYHPTTSQLNRRDGSALNVEGPYPSYFREAKTNTHLNMSFDLCANPSNFIITDYLFCIFLLLKFKVQSTEYIKSFLTKILSDGFCLQKN